MNTPIDVLTVMAQDAYDADAYRGVIGADKAERIAIKAISAEARAAVIELIAAARAAAESAGNWTTERDALFTALARIGDKI